MTFERGFSSTSEVADAGESPEKEIDSPYKPKWNDSIELPDDAGGWQNNIELPDDTVVWKNDIALSDDEDRKNEPIDSNETTINGEDNRGPRREKIEGRTYYFDDNGKQYRVDNELMPNTEYEVNKYKYVTDDLGRIVLAEGSLRMKEHDGRLAIRDSIEDIGKGDQKEGDDRGHLIGDQFDGSNGLENMVPQDANINRNGYKQLENELARAVKCGSEVYIKVEPIYEGESRRPSVFVVTYSIDGNESMAIFQNDQEV